MEQYQKIRIQGQGTFGYAILVQSISNQKYYIMKVIDISQMDQQQRVQALNEVHVLKAMRHPYIITYRESFMEKRCLCIVMDYADGGDLYTRIKKQKQKNMGFSEKQILDWFVQMALALNHVHENQILHRDLKTQNIFLTANGDIKIGDFGIARVLQHTYDCAKTAIGTPYYLSPEICQEKPYNQKSDIWSLGCILYQLTTLNHAFDANSMQGLVLQILRGTYPPIPSSYSNDLRNLISQMLIKDPAQRPSIQQILDQPFLKERIKELLITTVEKQTDKQGKILEIRDAPYSLQDDQGEDEKRIQVNLKSSKESGIPVVTQGPNPPQMLPTNQSQLNFQKQQLDHIPKIELPSNKPNTHASNSSGAETRNSFSSLSNMKREDSSLTSSHSSHPNPSEYVSVMSNNSSNHNSVNGNNNPVTSSNNFISQSPMRLSSGNSNSISSTNFNPSQPQLSSYNSHQFTEENQSQNNNNLLKELYNSGQESSSSSSNNINSSFNPPPNSYNNIRGSSPYRPHSGSVGGIENRGNIPDPNNYNSMIPNKSISGSSSSMGLGIGQENMQAYQKSSISSNSSYAGLPLPNQVPSDANQQLQDRLQNHNNNNPISNITGNDKDSFTQGMSNGSMMQQNVVGQNGPLSVNNNISNLNNNSVVYSMSNSSSNNSIASAPPKNINIVSNNKSFSPLNKPFPSSSNSSSNSNSLLPTNLQIKPTSSNQPPSKNIQISSSFNKEENFQDQGYGQLVEDMKDCLYQNRKVQEVDQESCDDKYKVFPKFLQLEGKQFSVPGVSERDTTGYKIEALRVYLEKQIGSDNFIEAYKYIMNQESQDDGKVLFQLLGQENVKFIPLIYQLIVCEESYYENQSN